MIMCIIVNFKDFMWLKIQVESCFLLFHEIKDPHRNKQKPETDLLDPGHLSQSASEYAHKLNIPSDFFICTPLPGASLRYL